jgi:replicative DNA helicase
MLDGSPADFDPADAPPHDLDAEGTLLSHCLKHGPIAGLLSQHFYSDANRYVYEALSAVQQPPDIIDIKRHMRESGRLRQIGGVGYLATLDACQPATAYPERHAETIREMYRRRVLSDALLRLRVEIRLGQTDSRSAWTRLRDICDTLTTTNPTQP